MGGRERRANIWRRVVVVGLLLVTAGARAQLIPLLPPMTDEQEEPSPQQNGMVGRIQTDLAMERFADLERMADRFRREKTRVTGGRWRLRQFYTALDLTKPSDEAAEAQIAHLEHWIERSPESITPRVALAQTYHHWAWSARGTGVAATVTPAMAKLFFERIEKEEAVLKEANGLKTLCPEWYSEMMTVALAESWKRDRMEALYHEAVAFEPGYLYYYREYANYLLPKWEGQPGDATAFATKEADRLGGDQGDLVYFEFATVVIKRGNGEIPTKEMDWARIKRGAEVLVREYGHSFPTMNQLAFMAYQYQDRTAAAAMFAEIGDRWGQPVWGSRANYERARLWATGQGATSPAAN